MRTQRCYQAWTWCTHPQHLRQATSAQWSSCPSSDPFQFAQRTMWQPHRQLPLLVWIFWSRHWLWRWPAESHEKQPHDWNLYPCTNYSHRAHKKMGDITVTGCLQSGNSYLLQKFCNFSNYLVTFFQLLFCLAMNCLSVIFNIRVLFWFSFYCWGLRGWKKSKYSGTEL